MKSFACLSVIGCAVVGLGLTVEAFAQTAEAKKVLGVECPSALQDSLLEAIDRPAIVLVIEESGNEENGNPGTLIHACVTSELDAISCDDPDTPCPDRDRTRPDYTANFYKGNSPGTICWYPCTGGGCGCNYVKPKG